MIGKSPQRKVGTGLVLSETRKHAKNKPKLSESFPYELTRALYTLVRRFTLAWGWSTLPTPCEDLNLTHTVSNAARHGY